MTPSHDPATDRLAVIDATTRMAWHTDRREWDQLAEVLADEVTLDYTSLNGGDPSTLPREGVVTAWRAALAPLDSTQHLIANHLVTIDGDAATCTAAFQATHLLANPYGAPTWTLGGHYELRLARATDGWQISAVTMTADWAHGNQRIMTLASEQSR